MMNQFELLTMNGGERYLVIVDTSRWDFYIGFCRIIKRLDNDHD